MVVSSTFFLEHAQVDGSRWCTEVHEMDDGTERTFYYLCAPETDPEAVMAERVSEINVEVVSG